MAKKNENAVCFRTSIGGQALMEGILMRGPDRQAVVCRTAEGLTEKVEPIKPLKERCFLFGWPVVRGVAVFADSMIKGMKALTYSAELLPEEEQEKDKIDLWLEKKLGSEKAEKAVIAVAAVLGLALAVALFIVLTTFLIVLIPGLEGQYGLRNLLATVLREELTALGLDPAPASIRVHTISDVSLSGEGKRMDTLHLTVQISGRTRQDAPSPATDADQEEVELILAGSGETTSPLVAPSPTPSSEVTIEPSTAPSAAPSATPAPVYGPFTVIEQPFTLDIPVFPTAEKLLAMSISSNYENELWTMVETDTAYRLEARRFGHGVGMSQRGAEWMAGRYQKTYQEILAFYYPGMSLMRYDFAENALPAAPEALAATPGPAPTPTPRPTLMPVSQQPAEGQWIALVTGIDNDSSLNLRSLPDLSGEIVMRLYKNQRLLVLERCEEDGWVKVRTDAAEGYVMESYLTAE